MSNKKSSSTKPSQGGKEPVVQQAKRVPKPGKIGKEIEDIFALCRRRPEVQQPGTRETRSEIPTMKRMRTTELNNNPENEPRKRTKDGFKVFTEDEIGFNMANSGGTPLCPFDCNCCF